MIILEQFLAILLTLALAVELAEGLHPSATMRKIGMKRLSRPLSATAGNPGMQGGDEKPEFGFGEGIVGSRKDNGIIPEEIRQANLPKLNGALKRSLKAIVAELVMSKTVETTSNYMKEFRNDADQRWLCSWKNFNTKSFSGVFPGRDDSQWSDWLEEMIKTDKLEIQVLMNPPKLTKKFTSRRKGDEGASNEPELPTGVTDAGIRIEYMHILEPRKIAHQLLQVRESITKEIYLDLPCIRLENIEAVRYATTKIEKGEEEAIKSIKLTRSATTGTDSTPLRDRTYHDISVIITNFAIQMTHSSADEASQAYLDSYLNDLEEAEDKRTVVERVLHEYVAPMELLEEIHVRGLQQGLASMEDRERDVAKKVNILKLSQMLLDCRYAVSLEVKKILLEDDNMTRNYYKMIKDYGSFKKFDMEGKGKIRVVDLHAKPGDELYPSSPTNAPSVDLSEFGDGIVHERDAEESMENLLKESAKYVSEVKPKIIAVVKDDNDAEERGGFGESGPFLM